MRNNLFKLPRDHIPPIDEIGDIFEYCLKRAEKILGFPPLGRDYKIVLRPGKSPETLNQFDPIIVYLSCGASRLGYLFEAAHEAAHCIDDVVTSQSTWLAEAVATEFSFSLVEQHYGECALEKCKRHSKHDQSNYKIAVDLASSIDSDVIELGRRIRGSVGTIKRVSAEEITRLYPGSKQVIVDEILTEFPYLN